MSAPAWGDQTIGDASRNNLTGIISGTGSYLAGLDKTQFKLLHCTSTGSGFTEDHIYLCRADGTGTDDITGVTAHTHTNSTSEGGDFIDILHSNGTLIDTGSQFINNIDINMWTSTLSGTGTVEEHEDNGDYTDQKVLKMLTGATSGSGANLRIGGLPVKHTYESSFQAQAELSSTSNIAFKIGYTMESATGADDNIRKYGVVGCTSVNGNYFGRSADGDSRSDSDTGVAFSASGVTFSLIGHKHEDSADGIDFWINDTTLLNKTSDVPIDGEGGDQNLFRVGIKNNTAADKQMYLLKLRMIYHTTRDGWDSY